MNSTLYKILFLAAWFLATNLLAALLLVTLPALGVFVILLLCMFWCWQVFAEFHYEHARKQDFLHVLRAAAETQAPIEQVLHAYLSDRPRRGTQHAWLHPLLCGAFPGFYWDHPLDHFDDELQRLVELLERGTTLDRALECVTGLVSRETAMAITVGQFGGSLPQALKRLPDRQRSAQMLDMATRCAYPFMILFLMVLIVGFIMIFIIPKFEKIFQEFHLKLPLTTEFLIAASGWFVEYWYVAAFVGWNGLLLFSLVLFSSETRWYCPLAGRLYRMDARGRFFQVLGLMLESGKPLPEILDRVLASRLFPSVVRTRVDRLVRDLVQGQPLAESLARHQLATESMQGLIASAEKAQNLPWAMQELGATLMRRCAMLTYRIGMVVFPLAVFVCACLVGGIVVAMFMPLTHLIDAVSDMSIR